ncbi:WD40 repeat domain-containing protein [Nocardia exalbida]|uniref:WD40 repeat domain-containing protein n=1 Tax=Nocardia exalbida TaxID=290231 RepID=UPI000593A9AF|nr:WD40 repeat domain-containing protein [Nocardia exalbida]
MTDGGGSRVDPRSISTREEFAAAFTRLRTTAGLTVRQVVDDSGGLHGTVSGWFAGHHVPTEQNERMFRDVLTACGVRDPEGQQRWLAAVRQVRPTSGRRRSQGPVPYRGLEPFRPDDAEWLFGRAELTADLRQRVSSLAGSEQRILIVTGASGSGKSSLLRAGLLPALQREGRTAAVVTPGAHPAQVLQDPADVLVIDQFEETWTLCLDDDERADFLAALAGDANGRTHVLGLRADFYRHAAEEPFLHHALAHHSVLVGPLSKQALCDVIIEPARKANWTVEDELVQLLIVELAPRGSAEAHDTGALPLLSHALLETWQRSSRRKMTVADYNAVGGIAGAIEQTAETVYRGLTEPQRQITRRTFLRLLNIDDDVTTRRRVQRQELFFDHDSVANVNTVIERFATHRLLTVEEETVAITHEALIGAWSRMHRWLDEDRESLAVHRRLTQATQVWLDNNEDPSALLGPARLEFVQEWTRDDGHRRDLNQHERDYIAASIAHQAQIRAGERRRTRILQRMVAGLATALIATIVLTGVALVARSNAAHARDEALSRQIALQAERLRGTDPALSAQLALAAFRIQPTLEARSALLDSTAVQTPTRLLGPDGGTLVATDRSGVLLAVGRSDATIDLHHLHRSTRSGQPGSADFRSRIPAPRPGAVLGSVTMTPDGALLAAAFGGHIDLWDIANPDAPRPLATLAGTGVQYRTLDIGPDKRSLAATTTTAEIARWDITDAKHPIPLPAWQLPAGAPVIAFAPNGKLLAAAGNAGALRIWATDRDVPLTDIPPDGSTAQALSLRFSPDSSVLAVPGRANEVRRWDVRDPAAPAQLPALRGFTSYVNDVAFSPDGTRLAAVSSDNKTRVWRLDTDQLEMELPNPVIVVSVRFALDAHALITGSLDGTVRIWPLPGPVLRGAQSVVFQTPIDRSGKLLLVGTGAGDGSAHLWSLGDPAAPVEFPALPVGADERSCGAVALAMDGSTAAVGTRAGHVLLWDLRDPAHPRLTSKVAAVNGIVSAMTFTPDAKTLVVAGQDDPTVTLWDLGDPAAPRSLGAVSTGPGLPGIAAVDAAGAQLAIATSNESVFRWDIRDRARPRELPKLSGFTNDLAAVAFSPTAPILAAGSMDHTVKLFDLSDPEAPRHLATLIGAADAIITVNFGPDGTRLVGGASDNGIWVWDITDPRDPRRLAVLNAYTGRVNDAVYALDGDLLLAAGPDRIVRVWATDVDEVAAELCDSGSGPITATEWQRYLPTIAQHGLCPR